MLRDCVGEMEMVTEAFPNALVTGSAKRLGKLFALTLAERGFAILLHYDKSEAEARDTAREIKKKEVPVHLIRADLTIPGEIEKLFSEADSFASSLQVLINSAAIMPHRKLQEYSAEEWDKTFNLNLRAPFLLTQQAVKRMKKGGVIINISDAGAHKLWDGYPGYVLTKSALEDLTRLMAKEYAPLVRVNAIAPGLVIPHESLSSEKWNYLVDKLPLKKVTPERDIASALTFLLENESITGQTIVVDGGYSLL